MRQLSFSAVQEMCCITTGKLQQRLEGDLGGGKMEGINKIEGKKT